MIVASVEHLDRYVRAHHRFARAVEFVRQADLAAFSSGRHEVEGDQLYVSIDHKDGRGRDGARLEAHRRYIDLQITLAGEEEIGWTPLERCRHPVDEFSAERDIVFFSDAPDLWVPVPPGRFALFFPEDAHAPLAGRGALRKAIVKILV
jgi:YhcH/YjgK/YiaL family protein